MKTKNILSISFLMVAIIVTLPFPVSWAQPIREVVVGNICAMTGPTSGTHLMHQSGLKDYLSYLNEKIGGIEGKKGKVKTKVLTYDSQYVATKAKDGFARLRDQGMIVHTHIASGHSDALMQDYEQAKIPLVTSSHGVASMWSDWAYGHYHSGVANMIRTWIVWVKGEWKKTARPGETLVLGTMTTDEPWRPLVIWDIDSFVKEQGIKLEIDTILKGTTDASPQLLRLKQAGSKQIFVLSSAPGAVLVLTSAKAMGLNIKLTQCAASTLGEVIALGGTALAEGYQGEFYFEPMTKNPKIPNSAGMKLAKELWAKNHPREAEKDQYITGILSGMIIEEGLRLALDEVSPEKLNGEALKIYGLDRIRNFIGMGLTPPISYTPGDHIGSKQVRYWVARGGFLEPVSEWMPTTVYRIPKK